ncbi:MAG: HD-GYP domain-containing protein [Pseudothermotoga sp.]
MKSPKVLFVGGKSILKELCGSLAQEDVIFLEEGTRTSGLWRKHWSKLKFVIIESSFLDDETLTFVSEFHHKNLRTSMYPYVVLVTDDPSPEFTNAALSAGVDNIISDLRDTQALLLLLKDDSKADLNSYVQMTMKMMQDKDLSTFLHSVNVSKLSLALSTLYFLSEKKIGTLFNYHLKIASCLHDIGKLLIPEVILRKPSRLTEDEFSIMKRHTVLGSNLFEKILEYDKKNMVFSTCVEVCRYHHEKFDGNGYPEGLKANQIPLSARIVAIADVFDALTSNRCYRGAYSFEKAIEIMQTEEKVRFDPYLLQLFLENVELFRSLKHGEESDQFF